ncbi:MAG TPA: response regulator [Pyrinomonadaceae bacterium]
MHSTRERILFIDEHEDTREVMTALLSRRGCEVVAASSLITALLISRGQTFHLYVLDAQFWGDTGTELCRSIREFDPLTPIIVFSNRAEEAARREAFEAGATDYLIKPDADGLTKAAGQCIRHCDGRPLFEPPVISASTRLGVVA